MPGTHGVGRTAGLSDSKSFIQRSSSLSQNDGGGFGIPGYGAITFFKSNGGPFGVCPNGLSADGIPFGPVPMGDPGVGSLSPTGMRIGVPTSRPGMPGSWGDCGG